MSNWDCHDVNFVFIAKSFVCSYMTSGSGICGYQSPRMVLTFITGTKVCNRCWIASWRNSRQSNVQRSCPEKDIGSILSVNKRFRIILRLLWLNKWIIFFKTCVSFVDCRNEINNTCHWYKDINRSLLRFLSHLKFNLTYLSTSDQRWREQVILGNHCTQNVEAIF